MALRRRRLTPTGRLNRKTQQTIAAAKTYAATIKNKMFAEMYVYAIEQYALHGNKAFLEFIGNLRQPPVPIQEFLDSDDFIGSVGLTLWPVVRQTIIDINKYWWKGGAAAYDEVVLAGSTGSGKTEICKVTTAYHLHILGCMKSPQLYYGLPQATSIVFTIQAAKPHVTKKVVYMPLRNYVETMPWFQRHMRPNKLIESEMYFDTQNIRVVPGGSDSDTILGEAIIHSHVDEINFMNVVERSKKAGIGSGRAGTYDQAKNIYDAVSRRKRSRFMTKGPTVGMICVSSSTRYKGDFTDKRIQYIRDSKVTTSYIYDKAQYDVWPQDRYSGDKFRLLVANDAAMDIRILEDTENAAGGRVIEIPIEYKQDFLKDAPGALRDIVGLSVNSVNPFFRQQYKVMECVTRGEEAGLATFLHKDNIVLGFESLPLPMSGHFCRNPSKPRYVHIDLAVTSDRAGICMVRYDGIQWYERKNGETEALPMASVEMCVTVEPDHNHEVDISEVRTWVSMLKTRYGYPIKAVTYDGYNSKESMQAWRKKGMKTGLVSVDRSSAPYRQLRDAIYEGRLMMYHQPVLLEELLALEFDEKKDKVDHPPAMIGKDAADSLTGAYHTMLTRSSSWVMPGGGKVDEIMRDDRVDLGDRLGEDYRG